MGLFLETIGSSWQGVTAVLLTLRLLEHSFEKDTLREMQDLTLKYVLKAAPLEFGFDFDVKSDALYKLLMPRLPVALATEF